MESSTQEKEVLELPETLAQNEQLQISFPSSISEEEDYEPDVDLNKLFEESQRQEEEYQNGFWDGYYGISKDNYEGYLSEKSRHEFLLEETEKLQEGLREVEEKLETNQKNYLPLITELKLIQYSLDYKLSLRARRQEDFNRIIQEIDRYRTEIQNLRNKYSFLAGVLFLIAGFVFIMGDLIISHEVVAYALNIKNPVEAWSFAIGLAMVPILLKPAYDRLVEQPYIQNKTPFTRRIYLAFKVLIVLFTVATLWTLGVFRYEAYRTDKLKENLNRNIALIQTDSETLSSEEALKSIEKQAQESNRLNQQLVSSPTGMYSFIFSGVMFAIAGAICLGISFPVLEAYTRIWFQIPLRVKKLNRQKVNYLHTLEEIEKEANMESAQAEIKKAELDYLGIATELEEQKKTIEALIAQKKSETRSTYVEMQYFQLAMGYEKGKFVLEKKHEQHQQKQAFIEKRQKASLQKKLQGELEKQKTSNQEDLIENLEKNPSTNFSDPVSVQSEGNQTETLSQTEPLETNTEENTYLEVSQQEPDSIEPLATTLNSALEDTSKPTVKQTTSQQNIPKKKEPKKSTKPSSSNKIKKSVSENSSSLSNTVLSKIRKRN